MYGGYCKDLFFSYNLFGGYKWVEVKEVVRFFLERSESMFWDLKVFFLYWGLEGGVFFFLI